MAADIVEGADLVVVVANDGDRRLADIDDHDVARLRDVGLDADIDPVATEDDLHVRREHVGAEVELGGKGVAGPALAEKALQGVGVTSSMGLRCQSGPRTIAAGMGGRCHASDTRLVSRDVSQRGEAEIGLLPPTHPQVE